jgi:hypothetical protein
MLKTASIFALGVTLMSAPLAFAQAPADNITAMQPVPNPPNTESPQQNVKESQSYQSMVAENPGFRNERIKRECGGIEDADLKKQCIDSFPESKGKAQN